MIRSRRTAGTSLVEILVVIVVFLIGILAIVQIFPGGFRLLGLTRSGSVATQVARREVERLKARTDQLAERIVPVRYARVNGELVALVDSTRLTHDLGPTADSLDQNGNLFLAGDNLGGWRRAAAANMVNRIVGESVIIPAPRSTVDGAGIGDLLSYGGLMTLQFGPALFNVEVESGGLTDPDGDKNEVLFIVYGNDLSLVMGPPPAAAANPYRANHYFCDAPDSSAATLYVPQSSIPIRYRLAFTAYVRDAGNNVRSVEVLDAILPVLAGAPDSYAPVSLDTFINLLDNPTLLAPGETFIGVEFDSIQLAPLFERLAKATSFTTNNPYEYKLVDDVNIGVTNANMGVLLFNPAGYKYFVPNSQGRRIPLTARVNYNVYDWGLIRDEFRIPSESSDSTRLVLSSLKVKGNTDTDGRTYQGLGFRVPNGAGGNQELDVVVQDTETGGIYAFDEANLNDPQLTAYRVDKSQGSIRFQDRNTSTPELEVTLYDPGTWNRVQIDDARGRSVRVFYQSTQEYQVQVMKSAARYVGVAGTPGAGQCALGALGDPLQQAKLYFSNSDLGRSVSVDEAYVVWDLDGPGPGGAMEVRKVSLSGAIRAPSVNDPNQLPYLDMADIYGNGWALSWSNVDETGKSPGYMVRGIRGSSVAVRVLWNPQKFNLTADSVANMNAFDRWASNWRKSTTETFLQKGGIQ